MGVQTTDCIWENEINVQLILISREKKLSFAKAHLSQGN